ncbi:filamentous hemagglutinin N-terminal domain-containing protein [Variovorax paradoxus]|uniref:Heme/hemopexin-binding protein n=1 Tax=Variovorax paradoxus TaxID=34073 RepID=A0A0H2M4B2_VARPD|nr:filamentous hemagglutinin N-terminal domain-containing protein [Variovorax paradoxus]KLN57208.1 heme/hemopexin-binding protein precursor [Variovorax paradoxus]
MRNHDLSAKALPRHWRVRPLVLSLACMGMVPAWAQLNLPTGFPQSGNVVFGNVSVASGGTATVQGLNQSTMNAIVNWNAFSLASGKTLNITQQMGSASVMLNRVVGTGGVIEQSVINGTLSANGHVFVVNPSGVLFGSTAQVNVGGLVASTLDISDSQIAKDASVVGKGGQLVFGGGINDANSIARVTVEPGAVISVGEGGTLGLIGALVRNEGQINVARGSAGLASGARVTLDFEGDGLTKFTVPLEGGLMNTSVAGVQATDPTTKALVMNTGSITADGGRVVLVGASGLVQQVVNQSGTVRARSLVERGGEIVLEAIGAKVDSGAGLEVSGTLDASGNAAGVAGGSIRTTAGNLNVLAGTQITAGGNEDGANGSWTAEAGRDLSIVADADAGNIAASVIGKALSQGTDVTLTTRSSGTEAQINDAVVFQPGAQVIKDGGGAATLRVNSVGNIDMRWSAGGAGATIASTSGALNVEFNADAQGLAAAEVGQANGIAAAIRLDRARIDANGGNIRFFGQGDSDNGRAIGGQVKGPDADGAGDIRSGVWLGGSTLSTLGAGSISLRGEGGTAEVGSGFLSATDGVRIDGDSTLSTQAGGITLAGRGAAGGSGLRLNGDDYSVALSSASGDIALTGTVRDWTSGGPVGEPAGGAGVQITGAKLTTGGDVRITGQGGDLSGMAADLRTQAVELSTSYTVGASNGVVIDGTRVEAGAGRSIAITGTAGSAGFGYDGKGAALVFDPMDATVTPFGVQLSSSQQTDGLHAAGGSIRVAAGTGDVGLTAGAFEGTLLDAASTTGTGGSIGVTGRNILAQSTADASGLADASGAGGGGSIEIRGTTAPGAGNENSGVVSVGPNLTLLANALGSGNGGSITLVGERSMRAFGDLQARGGSAGGNGGTIETSGGSFDVSGIRVDASAPAGLAGRWIVDPYDVTIVHGAAGGGGLPTNPFEPVATSTIQDGDINGALNTGTSVTITTGSAGTDAGDIRFGSGMLIERTVGSAPLVFELNAAHSIGDRVFSSSYLAPIIRSTTGPMDVIFNAGSAGALDGYVHYFGNTGADQAVISTNGGSVLAHATGTGYAEVVFNSASIDTGGGNLRLLTDGPSSTQFVALSGDVHTRGGSVTLDSGFVGGSPAFSDINIDVDGTIDTGGGAVSIHAHGVGGIYDSVTSRFDNQIITNGGAVSILNGQTGAPSGFVLLQGTQIDTRVGQSDAGAGGDVSIAGGGVSLNGVRIDSATGDVAITGTGGTGQSGSAVQLDSLFLRAVGFPVSTAISTTSGNVLVRGVQDFDRGSSAFNATHGVLVTDGSSITTGSGNIALQGLFASAVVDGTDSGVRLENGARLATTGGGSIELTGSSLQGTPGVSIQPGLLSTGGPGAAPQVQSSGNLVLRASNDGSAPALAIDVPVSAAGTINLRPGGMDAALNAFDATAAGITVGGAAGGGFTLSDALMSRLNAPSVVVGSNTHAGTITVAGALATGGALTLQNEGVGAGAGGIVLNGAVTADRLGLLSAGDITQTVKAPITAQHLLARSSRGSVLLDQAANNVSENTLGGGAAGAFRYQDVDGVRIGALSVTGFDAGTNLPQVVSATSMAADTVFVRTLSGDLTLDTAVTSTSGTDLVAASRFQNAGGGSVGGAPWRIWADTWVGESRGGIAGSGATPNLFHCAYLGLCTVSITPGDNHFIYAQQPRATVVIGDASRPFGMANPPFGFTISGLILGDGTAGFLGTPSSSAGVFSPAGRYAITGSFTSAAGYAVDVVPGTLTVTASLRRPDFPSADLVRELPNTNTYTFDRNIGAPPICFATGPLEGERSQQGDDLLAREWSRVRSRPNLTSCVATERKNGCADY